jgi:hypothetical protein
VTACHDRRVTTPPGLVRSYVGLRRAVGVIGVALPFVLLVGKLLLDGPPLPGSISAYYYTGMRNVLVGLLVAVGVFLLCYRYELVDRIFATIAGVGSIGVAMFPTQPPNPTPADDAIGVVHVICAAAFFVSTAVFSLFIFTRSDGHPTPRKRQRNAVYYTSGTLIVVSMVLSVIGDNFFPRSFVDSVHLVYVCETIAEVAFGVAWLVKGETVLTDQR